MLLVGSLKLLKAKLNDYNNKMKEIHTDYEKVTIELQEKQTEFNLQKETFL